MVRTCNLMLAVAVSIAFSLSAPMAAEAQNLADRDAKEVADYVLTEAALAKYTKAVHKLHPLKEQLQQGCDREDTPAPESLNSMAARLDAVPETKATLKATGMTSREYLVVSFSVFQNGMAAWALDQPGGALPPGTKPANVTFYRAHKAELEKLGELTREMDCDNQ